ncbi:MAG: hypothetical protein EPO12_03180 [Aquabacterium sp.]|jgi:hypothetical protein|nr:MAG: hypothetical protein EPO12_03180 [Aquabacterium sp.]
MKNVLRSAAAAAAILITQLPAQAAIDVKGVKFEDNTQVGGQSISLNGAGVRTKFFMSVYAAGLYVPKKDGSAQTLVAQSGPKSVHAVLLMNLTAAEFADALVKGFTANHTPQEMTKLQSRLDELKNLIYSFGEAKKGMALHLDFVPGAGTRVLVDGQQKGKDIPGEDFYQGLLKIWLGEHPVDSDLKGSLTGK